MLGVTIAIGTKFQPLAAAASEAVKRFYEVDAVVTLGEKELAYCPARRLFPEGPAGDAKRIFWIKFLIPQIIGSRRFLYHDGDYRPIRKPDRESLDLMHNDGRFIAVADWWPDHPYPWPYRNAGFFCANESHASLFEWCRLNYFQHDETYGDQCILNRGIATLRVPVLELPRAFNVGKPEQCPLEDVVGAHGYWLST